MTAQIIARTETGVEVGQETAKYAVKMIGVVSALIGLWGMACLIGGLADCGVAGLLQAYLTALHGL